MFPDRLAERQGFRRTILTTLGTAAVLFAAIAAPSSAAEAPIICLAISPDADSILTASQKGVEVCDSGTFKAIRRIPTRLENVHDLKFSRDGSNIMLVGGPAGESGDYEWRSWPKGDLLNSGTLRGDVLTAVTEVNAGSWVAAAHDGTMVDFSIRNDQRQSWVEHSKGINDVAYLGDATKQAADSWIITASSDHTIRVWSAEQGKHLRTLDNHTKPVYAIGVRPATTGLPMIASASADRTVRFWQPTIGRMVRFVRLDSTPLAIAWKPDGSLLLAATDKGELIGIEPETARIVFTKPALSGWAYALTIDPAGTHVFVGGQYGEKKIVSLE